MADQLGFPDSPAGRQEHMAPVLQQGDDPVRFPVPVAKVFLGDRSGDVKGVFHGRVFLQR